MQLPLHWPLERDKEAGAHVTCAFRAAILRSALHHNEWHLGHLAGRELVADSFTKVVSGLAFERALQDLCIQAKVNKTTNGGGIRKDQEHAKVAMLVGVTLLSGAAATSDDDGGDELSWLWTIGLILMCVGAVYVGNKAVRSGMWLYKRLLGTSGGSEVQPVKGREDLPHLRMLQCCSSEEEREQRRGVNQRMATYASSVDMEDLQTMVAQGHAAQRDPYNKMHGRNLESWSDEEEEPSRPVRLHTGDQLPRRRKKKRTKTREVVKCVWMRMRWWQERGKLWWTLRAIWMQHLHQCRGCHSRACAVLLRILHHCEFHHARACMAQLSSIHRNPLHDRACTVQWTNLHHRIFHYVRALMLLRLALRPCECQHDRAVVMMLRKLAHWVCPHDRAPWWAQLLVRVAIAFHKWTLGTSSKRNMLERAGALKRWELNIGENKPPAVVQSRAQRNALGLRKFFPWKKGESERPSSLAMIKSSISSYQDQLATFVGIVCQDKKARPQKHSETGNQSVHSQKHIPIEHAHKFFARHLELRHLPLEQLLPTVMKTIVTALAVCRPRPLIIAKTSVSSPAQQVLLSV